MTSVRIDRVRMRTKGRKRATADDSRKRVREAIARVYVLPA